MDRKNSWSDNGFGKRLSKSVKHEEVCLHAYDSVSGTCQGLPSCFLFYN